MTVPFPRTVPADAPQPPAPLLDQRAARSLFLDRRRAGLGIVGYRLAPEGVHLQRADGDDLFYAWAEVLTFVRELWGRSGYADPEPDDDDDEPSRRERRQQRRRQGLERGDDS